MKTKLLSAIMLAFCLTSCEKPFSEETSGMEENASVILRISGFEKIPFDNYAIPTRGGTDISQLCTRITFAVFNGEEKVKSVNQSAGDKDFGKVGLNLASGKYQIAVIAHNGDGAATVTSLSKITFPNNKVTDTFCYYGEIEVGTSPKTYDLDLKRCVAMFRLVMNDALPEGVSKVKFYYTGGSSTLSAITGYGSVNSRQTVVIPVDASSVGKSTQYEVYTIPHEETDELKMTVTVMDASENTLYEKVFESVPVQRNMITQYAGDFFGTTSTESTSFSFQAEGEWASTNNVTY